MDQMKVINSSAFLPFVFVMFLILGMIIGCQQKEKRLLNEALISLNDSLVHSINQNGELQSSKSIVMGEVKMLKMLVNSKDSTIAALAKQINKRSIAVGKITQVIADTIEIPGDTVYVPGPCDTIQRNYQLQDDWGRYRIDLRGQRAFLAYEIKNSFSVDMSWNKRGLFKPAIPVVTVTDHNPHSKTEKVDFLMVNVRPPKKKGLVMLERIGLFAAGFGLAKL